MLQPLTTIHLRSPGQVRSLLAGAGIDLPLYTGMAAEGARRRSPLGRPLLNWRKAERVATT